ncbi:MAG: GNAT family N-acetyltransferase [Christensenellaceae bacterium]
MIIKNYKIEYLETLARLFYETVHFVNAQNYTTKQLNAWAPNQDSLKSRCNDLLTQKTLVAETDGKIVGFGSIDKDGYLDLLFVHKDYQMKGVATALCDALESDFSVITAHSSITAKPFFEKRGYKTIKSQNVERCGEKLQNFEMKKNKIEVI